MDAEQIVQEVADRVREIVSDAEQRAAQIVSDAEQEASRIRARAETEGQEACDEALASTTGGAAGCSAAPPPAKPGRPACKPGQCRLTVQRFTDTVWYRQRVQ